VEVKRAEVEEKRRTWQRNVLEDHGKIKMVEENKITG